jgi:hypothetical protein
MPANTPTYSFPYPLSTDFVKDGATNIQNLAQAVEDTIETLPTRVADLIMNGSMRVAQRGTSVTGINTPGYKTVDRWLLAWNTTAGVWTQTQNTADLPPGAGAAAAMRLECTTARTLAAGNSLRFYQRVEATNCSALDKGTAEARPFIVDFWVETNKPGTYVLEIEDTLNSRKISRQYTIAAADTWQRVTITIPADTTGTIPFGTGTGLEIIFWLQAGTNFTSGTLNSTWGANSAEGRAVGQTQLGTAIGDYISFTNVQAIPGSIVKDFVQRPIGETVTQCQRYYYRLQDGVTGTDLIIGRNISTTQANYVVPFNVPMRVAPTSIDQSGTASHYQISHGATNTNCSAVPAILTSTTRTGAVQLTVASGLTAGQASALRFNNALARLAWSADL